MRGSLSTTDAFWQQPVTKQLQQQLKKFDATQRFAVACSGGRDSLSLARALQLLRPKQVRVIHINHQLQAESGQWADWLVTQCNAWQLDCTVQVVDVALGNVEAQARNARYKALFELLQSNEVLVLGHHAQDQAETIFLRLLSGSGVTGLSAMKALEHRNTKWLWRPLLDCTRQQITDLAHLICPQYIDDPANQQANFDRVFLRQQVWPLLSARWPAIDKTLGRTALLMQDTATILQDVLRDDWAHCVNLEQLDIERLLSLSIARQRLLLSHWMQAKLPQDLNQNQAIHQIVNQTQEDNIPSVQHSPQLQYAPAFHMVEQVRQTVLDARQDATPEVIWQNWCFRRYKNNLYRLPKHLVQAVDIQLAWPLQQPIELPSGNWQWQQCAYGFPFEVTQLDWYLQARRGGEVVHLRNKVGHRALKKCLQEAKIAPWQREQVHLLWQTNLNSSHTSDMQLFGVLTPVGFWPTMQVAGLELWVEQGWLPVKV